MDALELDQPTRRESGGQVEHSPASDRRQLVPVADQRHPSTGGVGELEQCAGRVLVEHPGLVDDQEGAAIEARRVGCRLRPLPAPVLVPAVTVLVQEPSHGVRRGADFGRRDLCSLASRRQDQHPSTACLDLCSLRSQPTRLAGPGSTFDHGNRPLVGALSDAGNEFTLNRQDAR
jgi:hypothetical protein